MRELRDKVAVVTGAGSGLGAATARAFAAQGMDVVVVDIIGDRARETGSAVEAAGRRALVREVDVSDAAAMEELAGEVFDSFGGCHVLHNNAGYHLLGLTWDSPLEDYEWMFGTNFFGVVNGIRSFVPRMLDAGTGLHIVNTVSQNAFCIPPANGIYTATKYAVLGLTETLRGELAPHGIGVTALCPAAMSTRINEGEQRRPGGPRELAELQPLYDMMRGSEDVPAELMLHIDPDVIARMVIDAVHENPRYVMGTTGIRDHVAGRFDEILSAYAVAGKNNPELH